MLKIPSRIKAISAVKLLVCPLNKSLLSSSRLSQQMPVDSNQDEQLPAKPKSILEEELEKAEMEEINLVPKKVNADLKQQVAARLEKLNRRTQKAIVEILREKLSAEN